MASYLIQDENQTEAMERLLDPDRPKGPWRIQRPDGAYYKGYESRAAGEVFVADPAQACDFPTASAATHLIDIHIGGASVKYRKLFRGCVAVQVQTAAEPGDHVICACGMTHEASYCPTANGHGAAL